MKALVHIPALTLQEDGEPINGINNAPTDPTYEARCICTDAEKAARMGESVEKACHWAKGTAQRLMWEGYYFDELYRIGE